MNEYDRFFMELCQDQTIPPHVHQPAHILPDCFFVCVVFWDQDQFLWKSANIAGATLWVVYDLQSQLIVAVMNPMIT